MSKKTTIVQLPVVQQSSSITPPPLVSGQQPLSPREIECICRCFIRLIIAKEIDHEKLPTETKPITS